jgi:hypothetical protein
MKKGIVIALMVVFSAFAVGAAFAAINADGTLQVNKDAKVFPVKKLNADGTKKKNPVTFNHTKHGAQGCQVCHHTEKDLKAGATAAKSCFDCHAAEPKVVEGKTQIDAYEMIHGKTGKCLACHKDLKAKDPASKAPTACKECHGGAE